MANEAGNNQNGRKKSRQLNYFYIEVPEHGLLLHKSLHKNRSTDTVITWCYPLGKRVAYTYSVVRKNMQTAFTMKEVCEMLNRSRQTIETAILRGDIPAPQFTYGLSEVRKKHKYMFNESNIIETHAYLASLHRGRPRKDGLKKNTDLPSPRELRAIIRQQPIMGYLDSDGNFTPTWLAEEL